MTPHEEIELIVNTAYLRGCGSNFKTAIAAMQESEKYRLSEAIINVCEDGNIYCEYVFPLQLFTVKSIVYGSYGSYDSEVAIDRYIKDDERERLAELVKMIKAQ